MPTLSRNGIGHPKTINAALAKKPHGFSPEKIETKAFVEYRPPYQERVPFQENC